MFSTGYAEGIIILLGTIREGGDCLISMSNYRVITILVSNSNHGEWFYNNMKYAHNACIASVYACNYDCDSQVIHTGNITIWEIVT